MSEALHQVTPAGTCHSSSNTKIGVLVVNLGTPDAPNASAIRRYLRQFLSDPRVVEIPKPLWWPILYGPVLTFRPRQLVDRYASIWLDDGSPLLVHTCRQAEGAAALLREQGYPVAVEMGMRYGNPSLDSAWKKLLDQGCEKILTVMLYPQYAASTTATAVDEVARLARRERNQPAMRFVKQFADFEPYIEAMALKVEQLWSQDGRPERLVMSFHGIPKHSVDLGDPYEKDCYVTAHALAKRLGLAEKDFLVTFQSRFGPSQWLEPYTEPSLIEMARAGVSSVDVICPGFLADCLETVEEIAVECRDAFLEAGGQQFRFIPCLNDDPVWIEGLSALIRQHLQGWFDPQA